jgi:hypothetical protein
VPGKTPYEAVEAHVQPLQEAVSCLSHAAHFATAGGHFVSEKPHALTLVNGVRLRLQDSQDTDLTLSVSQQYHIVEHEVGFRVHTLKYAYKIDNWHDGHEVMAYHWHPAEQIKLSNTLTCIYRMGLTLDERICAKLMCPRDVSPSKM